MIYIDHYGNAVTGLRAEKIGPDAALKIGRRAIRYARVFDAAAPGKAFWYENANGLVEIAVNQWSAARALGLKLGQRIVPAVELRNPDARQL